MTPSCIRAFRAPMPDSLSPQGQRRALVVVSVPGRRWRGRRRSRLRWRRRSHGSPRPRRAEPSSPAGPVDPTAFVVVAPEHLTKNLTGLYPGSFIIPSKRVQRPLQSNPTNPNETATQLRKPAIRRRRREKTVRAARGRPIAVRSGPGPVGSRGRSKPCRPAADAAAERRVP